ncbi:hypothetical protein GA0115240_152615 [Streptomyces sp. DvalAA-14]|uniref:DUF5819 family protein n=1 Tax=unclassified Streptomyces TaxID=2593676 RepID=UPI00081B24B3|nr:MULTISPECIES: DUF5819 family protein [unclassified Streptomyces]MYS23469.1 hypothetical protein [Streptomyces sp. SID4948]SCE33745.1 hypothetical protein GA0115240_152615 [Streptomyces sp. DvalAA-14]
MTSTGPTDMVRTGGEPKAVTTGETAEVTAEVTAAMAAGATAGAPQSAGIRPGAPPGTGRPRGRVPDRPPANPAGLRELPPPLRLATKAAAASLVLISLLHVAFVFLHVAPANQISQRYARPIQSWIYPFFEQNWRLFAPEPESAVPQISVRAASTAPDGSRQVGGWLDLTAIDNADVRHSVFPSHTAQNMLRRAWSGYLDTHGNSDTPSSERAAMWQEYLRNIAAERVAANRHGAFTAIQLRVRTAPVAGLDATGHPLATPSSAVNTRFLPWWKASTHDH